MKFDCRMIIFSKNIYKEIELPQDTERVSVGTGTGCDVRLRRDFIGYPVELVLENRPDHWRISNVEGTYIDAGDVRKLFSCHFEKPLRVTIRHSGSGIRLFDVFFSADFKNSASYRRRIDISERQLVCIGSDKASDICLVSGYSGGEQIVLTRKEKGLNVHILKEEYGICRNGTLIRDADTIGNGDFFSVADVFFYYEDGILWTACPDNIVINGLEYEDEPARGSYPEFKRNTRIISAFDETPVQILDPPAVPVKQEGNFLLRLLPSMGMLAAAMIMTVRGSGTMLIFSGISAGTAVVTAIAGLRKEKNRYLREVDRRKRVYEEYIAGKRKEIREKRRREYILREQLYRPLEKVAACAESFSEDLFDRSPGDPDFLSVRLGKGSVEARRVISYKKSERLEAADELQVIPGELSEEYRNIKNCAVICDLREVNAFGISGKEEWRYELLRNLVTDIAVRHFYRDVKLMFIVSAEHRDKVIWLRMLPHVFFEDRSIRGIACDEESQIQLCEFLYKTLSVRAQSGKYGEHIIAVIYDEQNFMVHPVSKFLDRASQLGITFIFMKDRKEELIRGCDMIADLYESGKGVLLHSRGVREKIFFSYEPISSSRAEGIVRILAPVYTGEVSLENTLNSNISLFELLNIYYAEDIDLRSKWDSSEIYSSMAVPVGISRSGIMYLDIHDSAMGPHGLIAGTTGSGKSELLQTYILSLAVQFHPWDVQILIIDFKGGGMAAAFRDLPHLAGAVTNIDGKAIRRSLSSIKAELLKRQRLFEETGVNHIDKYIRKFKETGKGTALSHLVIIADEFAELKAQYPEFMKELISAARIGRSLGVHLILATQKPSGQVDEQIWSNSRFRICLKVQNANDSNEVLRSPLAAEIREAGRAYLQVGNNEIFELFQSAYSSGTWYREDECRHSFKLMKLSDSGRRTVLYETAKAGRQEQKVPQSQAIVQHISHYCENENILKLPDICLPPLKEVILFPDDEKSVKNSISDSCEKETSGQQEAGQIMAGAGIYDDPKNQYQGEYLMDLASRNIMIIGTNGSGKTNLLECMIRNIALRYSPEEVNIYIIDYASGQLKIFEELRHVGGVACAGDEDRTRNLFRILNEQLAFRKSMAFSAERQLLMHRHDEADETRRRSMPHIILMIDNLTALREIYLQDDQELLNICREGLSSGISTIAANARTSGIGYKYLADFGERIAFHCNDPNEYVYLFGKCAELPEDIPGRCLTETDREHFECQTYLAFRKRDDIYDLIEQVKDRYEKQAMPIPVIPRILKSEELMKIRKEYCRERFEIIAGIDQTIVRPYVTDLSEICAICAAGRKGMGKHNWLRYAVSFLGSDGDDNFRVFAIDGMRRKLEWMKDQPFVEEYSNVPDNAAGYVLSVQDILKQRYEKAAAGLYESLRDEPLILLILDNMDAVCSISLDRDALEGFRSITGKYRTMNICVVIMCLENTNISYNAPEILRIIRNDCSYLFFDDLRNFKLFDVPLAAAKKFDKPVQQGDAYLIRNNDFIKIKTPYVSM